MRGALTPGLKEKEEVGRAETQGGKKPGCLGADDEGAPSSSSSSSAPAAVMREYGFGNSS